MAFKINRGGSPSVDTPEALFRDLRTKRIPGLLAHQADILRNYVNEASDKRNVALQLPTGSGKTLVGLLLAEWRRRRFEERVVYLCPTNQLVNQVAEQASQKYGIRVHAFTGKVRDYTPAAKGEYQNGEAVAITSYSALFNTNPFFNDPDVIILDDAHAAENYVAAYWSLGIDRWNEGHEPLFHAIVDILKPVISPPDYEKLKGGWNESWDPSWVDKIPTPFLNPLLPEITAAIDAAVEKLDLRYAWSVIRDHLHACQLYVGAHGILIRPLIPPTNSHAPFQGAKQRLYMSATLGEGGDLERLTGQKNIYRLVVPEGWDKQGIGRRFFMFPGRSLTEEETNELVIRLAAEAGRSVMILPDDRTADERRELVKENLGFSLFNAREIELSKAPFVSQDSAVAVFSNRYDGIDFPEDECRLLVLGGLPSAVNLQERFIVSRMGSVALLNDRIRTRIVQAFGRCTRGATDYSAVVVGGEELLAYLQKREGREFLHPELQAELRFGIEQSSDQSIDGFIENFRVFLSQSDDWTEADDYIVSIRSECEKKEIPGKTDLESAVSQEIDFQYALWNGAYDDAYEAAISILDLLKDPLLQGYRALWSYLAGASAWLRYQEGNDGALPIAREHFRRSASATVALSWLRKLSKLQGEEVHEEPANNRLMRLIERFEGFLQRIGTVHEGNFAKYEAEVRASLSSPDAIAFESGHEKLGAMLGFDAGNRESQAAPDPWWIVDEDLCFIFEDHSNAKSDRLSVKKARQAATHPNWVRENLPISDDATIVTVLVSPVTKMEKEAAPHLRDVCYWNLDEFRAWANNTLSVVRGLRKTFPGPGDLVWRAEAAEKFSQNTMAPGVLIEFLHSSLAADRLQPE